ncbi:YLR326W [Zygosaccharomyces parabailii]|uniref:BN860_07712g1_1 n=1 Tax=Zygosaccharomyces bailii (strain CLIB 213 / ATCC 58445 / CBS 680 / BCRC 21525 / NBRC 1098 / NCYC 1416 / NRRL Y-2227) TaxID=1333698 RepID=A0A8J2X4X5_ZYGB2|nr:YLR326W [Zygosaccharomyces parabailii]CDF87496.1 BN860_07712g1_1 [Zygosaccharomyces bailii CLIB 213]CDH09357.1 uncharacterized protein ZBAI_01141 [Zygosaccharomyces bailii ISA1307]SJM87701.1 uncharacterized protein ZBIST_3890 [Zygosaccharomyces bailii]
MSSLISGFMETYGQGWLQDKATDFAGEHFQPTRDPYYEEQPGGKKVRRRLPHYCSKQESKAWKKLQNQAWSHDKGICGSCCWSECVGWAPMLTLIPIIGPAIMYSIHGKLVDYAKKQFQLPNDIVMKMHGNIGIDLAISLVPVLGTVFAWMNACSTRNCALVYNFVCERALEKYNMKMKDSMQPNSGAAGGVTKSVEHKEKTNGALAGGYHHSQTGKQYARPAAPAPGKTKDARPKAHYDSVHEESYPMQEYRRTAAPRTAAPDPYNSPPAYQQTWQPHPNNGPATTLPTQPRAQRPYV